MSERFSAFELEPGATYEVITAFEDFDGTAYAPGLRLRSRSHNFFPYDAGLTLYMEKEDGGEITVRLQDYQESQGGIISEFHRYVRRVS